MRQINEKPAKFSGKSKFYINYCTAVAINSEIRTIKSINDQLDPKESCAKRSIHC